MSSFFKNQFYSEIVYYFQRFTYILSEFFLVTVIYIIFNHLGCLRENGPSQAGKENILVKGPNSKPAQNENLNNM